ncbi:MAG: matrixin family metalloprotease [Candidatus Binatia bacterium]
MNANRLFVLAAAVAALSSATASAYVIDTDGRGHNLHWSQSVVGYRIVSGSVPGGAAGEAAVRNAFASWSGVSSRIQYRFDGYAGSGVQAMDNRNLVFWKSSGWPYDPTLLGITFRFFDTGSGRLLDADIVFNAERYSWSVGGSGYDVENSTSHEVGHFSGLGHSSDSQATMFASAASGETKKRSLSGDDIAGLSALYGGSTNSGTASGGGVVAASSDGVGGGGGGGCSVGSSRSARNLSDLLWTTTLLVAIVLRRRWSRREDRCVSRAPLSPFADGLGMGRAGGGSARIQHERGSRQAL